MGYKFQINNQAGVHYLTFTIVKWIDLFNSEKFRKIIIENLNLCQTSKNLSIMSFVIMPNHLHMIAQSKNNSLSKTIGSFKQFTAKKIIAELRREMSQEANEILQAFAEQATTHSRNSHYQVWQQNNHPVEIFSNKFLFQKMKYIHNNPVKAGLVQSATDYPFSSARNYSGLQGAMEITVVRSL